MGLQLFVPQLQQNPWQIFVTSKMQLSPQVVLLMLIRCWLLLSLWGSVVVLCFAVRYFVSILVLRSSRWRRESWLLCFVCLPGVLSLFVALPCHATGLSAVCDCGISDHTISDLKLLVST